MARKKKPVTNIKPEHKEWLAFIQDSKPSDHTVCLMSCFVNGEPTSAIRMVTREGTEFKISPMFVAVTAGMTLTDHDGTEA
jgi:hypothetical protein